MKFTRKTRTSDPVYFTEDELPEPVRKAVAYYAKQREQLAEATATESAKAASANKREREDMASNVLYSQQATDEAFGYLARIAKDHGGRACLCGRVERIESKPTSST